MRYEKINRAGNKNYKDERYRLGEQGKEDLEHERDSPKFKNIVSKRAKRRYIRCLGIDEHI